MLPVVAHRRAGRRQRPCQLRVSDWLAFIFRPTGSFTPWAVAASDTAGSEFTHPFEYDPVTNSLDHQVGHLSRQPVNNMACGVLTDAGTPYIYCVGGSASLTLTGTSDRVFRYDPVTDTISPVAAPWPGCWDNWFCPVASQCLQQQALYPGRIRHHHERRARDQPDLGVYSSPAAWVQKTTVLPVPLGYIPTTTIGSLIYTGGGSDITAGALTDTTNSFVYNPVANTIGTIAAIPRATGETRALNFNGKMYVMGGGRTAPNPSNEVDVYDPGANSWAVNSPVPAFVNARRNFPTDTDGTTQDLAGRRLRC